jgi:hypothetical protein
MAGLEENTRHAEGGTRHTLSTGVRPCPFCAGNSSNLFVACCVLSLLFVGVAVQQRRRTAVFDDFRNRALAVLSQLLASLMDLRIGNAQRTGDLGNRLPSGLGEMLCLTLTLIVLATWVIRSEKIGALRTIIPAVL